MSWIDWFRRMFDVREPFPGLPPSTAEAEYLEGERARADELLATQRQRVELTEQGRQAAAMLQAQQQAMAQAMAQAQMNANPFVLPMGRINTAREANISLHKQQRRQIFLEARGLGSWIADPEIGGKILAEDVNLGLPRRLYELELVWETINVLHVINHTVEPDGSRKEHWLVMPRSVKTPHEAVAHSFGFPVDGYKEAVAT